MRPRRVKLSDVASLAGVSPAAASMALNGQAEGNLAPATRDRILAAAAELNYSPDSVAQSLRRQKTHALGLITDRIAVSPFAGRMLAGAMDEARIRDYVLLVIDNQRHRDREAQAIAELTRRRVDGLLYATMALEHLSAPPATQLPFVLANCWADTPGVSVIPDETRAGDDAAAYLIGLGHRRIAMIGGLVDAAGPLRADAFTARGRAAGVDVRLLVIGAQWCIEAGYHAAWELLAGAAGRPLAGADRPLPAADRPTAIWGVNDRVATGVLLAALRLGLHVPEELSVMGMDDQEELADKVVPPLTTLALPHRRLGETAVSLLLQRIERPGDAPELGVRRLPCPLIERDSTAPPPPG